MRDGGWRGGVRERERERESKCERFIECSVCV